MTGSQQSANSPLMIALAALIQGGLAAVVVVVVLWFTATYTGGPVEAPFDTVLLIGFPLWSMGSAVWSRRPGQPRMSVVR